MEFLLDTDIVSNFRQHRPHPNLLAWMTTVSPDVLFMSATTVTEIQCGIGRLADPVKAADIQAWLDGMITAGNPAIVPFDAGEARLLGQMWTTPALDNFIRNDPRSVKHKSGADLAIAATAIVRGLVIVTNNVVHFQQIDARFPLPGLFSPFDGRWHVTPTAAEGA